ncbi:CS1-pili formation C-terminal domain-containing protein, partial [Chryseobacterium indologenes]|uniref:CS1-pili formation C-terminal domain-containing protein n=1 Tax=Chryseobacterium indologenes TaxID=253 RepID=UPI0016242CC9
MNGIMLLFPFALSAQQTHTVFGKILNQEGKIISNARVSINQATTTTTSKDGTFQFETPVHYPAHLMIDAKGYSGSNITLDSL